MDAKKYLFLHTMKRLLGFFSLLFSVSLQAQPYSSAQSLGIEQGLSNNYVVSVTQDKRGFMWFATESGLNRFDGKQFRTYKKYTATGVSISGNELNRLYADPSENVIWIATQRNGLDRFDCNTETFSAFTHDDNNLKSIASDAITDIDSDPNGNLWLATYANGVDLFDKKTGEFVHFNRSTLPALASDMVWSVADDGQGNLYIGHVDEGLSILSLKDRRIKHYVHISGNPNSLPDNAVWDIFKDNQHRIWVGTASGLSLYNPEKEEFINFKNYRNIPDRLVSNKIFSITQTEDHKLWVGTENGGVCVLDIANGLFLSPEDIAYQNIDFNDNDSRTNFTVKSIFQDKFGNIWLGTYGRGIRFIGERSNPFHKEQYSDYLLNKNGLPANTVWGMCEDDDGNIWIGTDGGGIAVWHEGRCKTVYTKENSPLSGDAILAAMKDSEGNLWFGTFLNGITIYDHKTRQLKPFSKDIFDKTGIRCFFEDNRKNVWIGTNGPTGMYSYNLITKQIKNYTAETHHLPGDNQIRAVAQDAKGRLWVGSFGNGLAVLDSAFNPVSAFHKETGFYSNAISFIFKDSRQRMWIGTGEGLVCFPNIDNLSDFRIFTEKDGLQDSYIRAITEDREGNIWFGSNSGISKYDLTDSAFYNYDHTDGLPVGQFLDGSVINSSAGLLYFGSQNGVCFFKPEEVNNNTELPPVVITALECYSGNRETDYPATLNHVHLQYNRNTFTFRFGVMDYALSDQVEYAYLMKGISDEWYPVGKNNEVTFRNVPAGKYQFSVRAKLGNQRKWGKASESFAVVVSPPFWWSGWAKLFYFLILFSVAYFIISFYKSRLKLGNLLYLEKQNSLRQQELNNEKLQFFTNITHELRTPLTLIVGPLEDLSGDRSLSEKAHKKISLIHQNAMRLLDLINKILDFRKTETKNMPLKIAKGDLAKLVEEIGIKYEELNQNPDIKIITSVETSHNILYFDREVLEIILDNLISNALKYTEKGEIRLTLREISENETPYTEIEVSDTGCGIPPSEYEKIFDRYYQVKSENPAPGTGIGLSLVKNLAALHQGEISVSSEEGKGTTFRFRLQTNNIYPNIPHYAENEDKNTTIQETETNPDKPVEKGAKKLMLIVEDNREILDYICDAFSDSFKILTAGNGKSGCEQAFEHIPDIVVSDIMMPEMSGIELCEILKKDIRTCHIPVILLTARTSLQDKTEGYASGADSYITKPFSASLLRSRVANLLESRKNLATQLINSKIYKQAFLENSVNQLDNEFIEKITSIIREHSSSENLDIEFIARQVAMSHSTLYRKIKAVTGLTINEFIRKIRLKQAEELLLTGKYTVSEIIYKVGFNDLAYFRKCFKDEFGGTPADYVKQLKQTKN